MDYDIIIIGGGIAGLYTALQYLKKYPTHKIVVLEKYKTLGGRVNTYKTKLDARGPIQWENGAGRVHESHTLILNLIKHYGLTMNPISSTQMFKKSHESKLEENRFNSTYLPIVLKSLKGLKNLSTMTFHDALKRVLKRENISKIVEEFPYWSEIYTMRADMAIESFSREMGTNSNYFYCKEGYSALIDAMVADIIKRGGKVIHQTECLGWNHVNPTTYRVFCKSDKKNIQYFANKLVFALHATALRKIEAFKSWPLLKYIKMEPLLRCYAVFPKNSHGQTWLHDIPKFVTATPIRHFIPINPAEGIAMISYTDGADARYLTDILHKPAGEYNLRRKLVADLRMHFPDRNIPDPLFFKTHSWTDGCSYWTPGPYNPIIASKLALTPFGEKEAVYVCGESFSTRQAWIEGALEHADSLLAIL